MVVGIALQAYDRDATEVLAMLDWNTSPMDETPRAVIYP